MAENLDFKGNKFCINHLKEKVKFMCEDCKQKACNTCVSSTHKGHNLSGIKLIVQEKYNKLQDLNNDIKKNKIPRVKKTLQTAEQSVKKIKEGIQANIKTAVKQGDYYKELIDISTAETVSELEEIGKKITKQLDQFKADSETVIKQFDDLMKESTEATKSDDNILIVDVEEHLSTKVIKEPEFVCDLASLKFVPGTDPESMIKTAFGTIVYEQTSSAIPTRKLTEPVISKLAELSIGPWSIQRTKNGNLWICGDKRSDPLTKMATDRSRSTLNLDTKIDYFCVDPVTDQLYCVPAFDNSIRTVDTQSGKTTQLFTTKAKPYCLNVTNNGLTFIVGTSGAAEVTLYDKKGTLLQTVTTANNPEHIAVCRSTGKVAITCGSGGVMVMENKADRLHHMYTYPTNGTTIKAKDAEFDDSGHLLVADHDFLTSFHIADATTGNILKMIKIEIEGRPYCLITQKNGDIIVGTQYPNELLTIKYLG